MEENKLLGSLLPASPDLIPIIRDIRRKYILPEISLNEEPISEIYLDDEIIPLAQFWDDLSAAVHANLNFMTPEMLKQYNAIRNLDQLETIKVLETIPSELKEGVETIINFSKEKFKPTLQMLEKFIDDVTNMLYEYILTGEAGEIPLDWSMHVMTVKNNDDNTLIYAIANQLADPEEVVNQFRQAYKKAFGVYRPRITKKNVSAGYYIQLARRDKPWKTIVEEFIRLEVTNMPPNINSKKYREMHHLCEQTLRKRMQRSEKVLDVIFMDKK